jgi:hypothetical protein
MERSYWDNGFTVSHHCGKSKERRADNFQSCGDRSTDFLNEFCRFYDSSADQSACKYYEERPLVDEKKLDVLVSIKESGSAKDFPFFSEGNRLCEQMDGMFVQRAGDTRPNGDRGWKLSRVGGRELIRAAATPESTNNSSKRGEQ